MKNKLFLNVISLVGIVLLMCGFTSCGFGHPCEKNWRGSYTRYSGDIPYYENWEISINGDGTCTAVNTVTGGGSYSHQYHGEWRAVSNDVIELQMKSEPYESRLTRSYADIEREANKAQTRWKKNEVYRKANAQKLETHTVTDNKTFFIRSDGATSSFVDGLDNPLMICK